MTIDKLIEELEIQKKIHGGDFEVIQEAILGKETFLSTVERMQMVKNWHEGETALMLTWKM